MYFNFVAKINVRIFRLEVAHLLFGNDKFMFLGILKKISNKGCMHLSEICSLKLVPAL
jgi:hypothetical protein